MKTLEEIIENIKGRNDIFPFIFALYNNGFITDRNTYHEFLGKESGRLAHLRAWSRGDFFKVDNFKWEKLDEANSPDTLKPPRVLKTIQPRQTPVDEDCRVWISFSTNAISNDPEKTLTQPLTVEDLTNYTYAPKGIFELWINKETFPTFLKESYRLVHLAPDTWGSACRVFNSRLLFIDIDYLSRFDEKKDVKEFGNVGFIYNLIDEFEGNLRVGYDDQSENPNQKHGYSYHLFAWITGDHSNLMESSKMSKDFAKSGVDIFQTKTSHLIHLKKGKKVFDGPLKEINSEYVKELQNILVQKKQNEGKNFFKDDNGVFTRLKGEEEWSLFGTKKFLPTNTISRLLKDNERFVKIETPVRSGKTTMTISTINEFAKKKIEGDTLLYIVRNKISRDEVYEGLLKLEIDFTRIVANGEQEGEKTQSFEEFVERSQENGILLMTHSMFGKNFKYFKPYIQNSNNILIIDEGHYGEKIDDSWSFLRAYEVPNLKNLASTFILSGNRTMNDSEDEEIVNSSFLRYRTNIELENQIKFNTFKCKSMNDFANYCLRTPTDSIDILLTYSKVDLFTAWKQTANQYPNKKIGFCWSGDTAGVKMFTSIRAPIYLSYDFIYTTSIVAGFSLQCLGESNDKFEKRMRNKVVRIGIEGSSHMNQAFINDITQLIGRFQPHWGIKIEIFFVSQKGTNAFPEDLLVPEVYTRFKNFETGAIDYKQTVKKEESLVFEESLSRAKKHFEREYNAKPEEFEFFKSENEFDLGEPNVIDFGSVWSKENLAEIERLNGIKKDIRKTFALYEKDKVSGKKALLEMKESLNAQEKERTFLSFEKYETRNKCIAKVDEVIERYIEQNIKNLKLLLNAFEGIKVIGIDKLPTIVKKCLQRPQTIVKGSVYWDLLVTGAFRAKGKINLIQTKECFKGSESFEFLKTCAIDADIMDNIVFENRRATIVKNISYFKTQVDTSKVPTSLKITSSPMKIAKEYFKENCMDMKSKDAVKTMQEVFPWLKTPKDGFRSWRLRLRKEIV